MKFPTSLRPCLSLLAALLYGSFFHLPSCLAENVPSGHIEVLFIGNSFTFYNDMPQMFRQLAVAANKDVAVEEMVKGGQSLQGFWTDPEQEALKKIQAKPWDFVVLQGWTNSAEDMRDWGTKFMEEAHKTNPKVQVLMYMVHPAGPYPDDATMESQQHLFVDLAKKRPYVALVPVEWAWKQGFQEDPQNEHWLASDNWHPGPRRSYIAAASMFATIYRQTPIGLANKTHYPAEVNIAPADATHLQELAWTALRGHSTFTGFHNPPRATITPPAAAAHFDESAPVPLGVTTVPGDAPIAKVEYYIQDRKIGESVKAPFSFTWTNPPAGKYNVQAKPIDAKGLSEMSDPVFITVTGPAKTIYSENFDAGSAAGWSLTGIGPSNGELAGGAWNSDPSGTYDALPFAGNYTYRCGVRADGDAFRNYNLVFNYVDKGNYYCVSVTGGPASNPVLRLVRNGSITNLATAQGAISAGNNATFAITYSRGFFSVIAKQGEREQVLFHNVYDGTIPSGRIGFFTTGGMSLHFDSVQVNQEGAGDASGTTAKK